MQEITIIIDKAGNYVTEVNGVEGPECQALTKALTEGDVIESTVKKPEYHHTRTVARKVTA